MIIMVGGIFNLPICVGCETLTVITFQVSELKFITSTLTGTHSLASHRTCTFEFELLMQVARWGALAQPMAGCQWVTRATGLDLTFRQLETVVIAWLAT